MSGREPTALANYLAHPEPPKRKQGGAIPAIRCVTALTSLRLFGVGDVGPLPVLPCACGDPYNRPCSTWMSPVPVNRR